MVLHLRELLLNPTLDVQLTCHDYKSAFSSLPFPPETPPMTAVTIPTVISIPTAPASRTSHAARIPAANRGWQARQQRNLTGRTALPDSIDRMTNPARRHLGLRGCALPRRARTP
ncbi:hypothetical protein SORBI_3003G180950 [Sorghum bicolor]|uniref:Uncharacterized protein n=1 Tax=Sorghum bicolor TaxID=4558 RepID=A0A1W0VXW0_SORBI|nr:hypothetical protein SORBI_3003G180950 [Sorghum bicolor]